MHKDSLVYQKSFQFALRIIELYKRLIREGENTISLQLLRSGTSVGANISEALSGYSNKDFSYKMSISTKEASESRYWLELLDQSSITQINVKKELSLANELVKMLTAIVKTSQSKKTRKTEDCKLKN